MSSTITVTSHHAHFQVLAGTTVMDNMTCVGSPTYMAPEIVSGDPYGAACDVWSLGVILYEMASFQRPFEGRSLGELVMRISSGQFKELKEHLQDKNIGDRSAETREQLACWQLSFKHPRVGLLDSNPWLGEGLFTPSAAAYSP
eukprot:Skav204975  [mRNA]  locus=scaffold1180:179044:185408:- [translate_table: standard]